MPLRGVHAGQANPARLHRLVVSPPQEWEGRERGRCRDVGAWRARSSDGNHLALDNRSGLPEQSAQSGDARGGGDLTGGGTARGWAVKGLAVCAATMGVALGRIDQNLASIHQDGYEAGGIGDLATPAVLFDVGRAHAVSVAGNWASFPSPDSPAKGALADLLTATYLALDLGLMVSLAAILCLWLCAVRDGGVRRGWLAAFIVLYLVADLVETILACRMWSALGEQEPLIWIIGGASLLKWVSLGVAVVSLAIVTARTHFFGAAGPLWQRVVGPVLDRICRYRAQVLVVGFLTGVFLLLSGDLGRQVDDVLVRSAEQLVPAGLATLAAVLTSAVVLGTCRACRIAYQSPPGWGEPLGRWWALAFILVGVTFFVLGMRSPDWRPSLFLAAIVAVVLPVLGAITGKSEHPEPDAPGGELPALGVLPHLLTIAPMMMLLLAIARALATQTVGGNVPELWWWLLVMLACIALVEVVYQWRKPDASTPPATPKPLVWAVVSLAALGTLWALSGWPIDMWMWVRTPAVLFLWATLAVPLLAGLAILADALPLRGALHFGALRRWPVLSLLLVCSLLATALDVEGRHYNVRLGQAIEDAEQPPDAATSFDNWYEGAMSDAARVPSSSTTRRPVSLVFVAAGGGGIRAAFWTALSWECVFDDSPCDKDLIGVAAAPNSGDRVFLASGVSGSSLGLASIRANAVRVQELGSSDPGWLDEALVADFVAPTLAAYLFGDLPHSLHRMPILRSDRAGALELAWEQQNPKLATSFDRATGEKYQYPNLILNSTSVEDSCRLVVSSIKLGEGDCVTDPAATNHDASAARFVRDAARYRCGEGNTPGSLSLSTAALLSARFPFVSPAGAMTGCGTDGSKRGRTFALDGGIFDNSGASAVEQVWRQIEPEVKKRNGSADAEICVIPRLLVLDNGYAASASAAAARRPAQVSAPLQSALGVYGARSDRELSSAVTAITDGAADAIATCHHPSPKSASDSVAVIHPAISPGTQAPLGWTLSSKSVDSMRNELREQHNRDAVKMVRCWFKAENTCARA